MKLRFRICDLRFWFAVCNLQLAAFVFFSSDANCQSVTANSLVKVSAKVDTNTILIGDHIQLNLHVDHARNLKINFPATVDSIGKLEIIGRSKIDTVKSDDSINIVEKQIYAITCFDSGYYAIPPFQFTYKKQNDTTTYIAETEPLLITVNTLPVDTTKAIKDIKNPLDVPFSWREALPYIIGGILLIAIIYLIFYFVKRRKKPLKEIVRKIPKRPAHEIALESLKKLENEKLWQQGQVKFYHSKLADIVRTYIEHHFRINAMEFTTDETLEHFNNNLIDVLSKEKLKQLLQLADLVKFAKVEPLPNENDMSLKNAYHFVQMTRLDMEKSEQQSPFIEGGKGDDSNAT